MQNERVEESRKRGEREKKKPKGELKEEQLGSWKEMTPYKLRKKEVS